MNEPHPVESSFIPPGNFVPAASGLAGRNIPGALPRSVETWRRSALPPQQSGFANRSVSLILQALQRDKNRAADCNDRGNLLFRAGDLAAAAAAFQSSVKLRGDDANVWNNLGFVLYRQAQFAAAENAYRCALRCDGDFVPALQNLAALLAETGREEESSLLSCRAFVLPPLAEKSAEMLGIAYYRLGRIQDAAACYRAWLRAEPDNVTAQYRLTACTGKDVPARTPDQYVKTLFGEMAESFEEKLVGKLSYRGPEIIAGLLEKHLVANRSLDVLDGGCGTGLCSPVLAPYARCLTGIDISPAMLKKAGRHALYGELVEAELTAYLRGKIETFDLIVMADTVIYFGDLSELFAAVRQALRPGGLLAFTVEAIVEPALQHADYHLQPSGRFGHSRGYLSRQLNAAGFVIRHSEDVALRSEFCRPAQGIGVLACASSH